MRIIAGTAKGIPLAAPRVPELRPTTDAMRETLFNVLADRVVGARFLDLFAGCGAVGIEALSRGAEWCTLVELSPVCVQAIRENLQRTGLQERAEVRRADARRALGWLGQGEGYDVVFVDPPYRYPAFGEVVRSLMGERQGLRDDAVVIIQHDRAASLPDEPAPTQVKRFGDTRISFYWQAHHGA